MIFGSDDEDETPKKLMVKPVLTKEQLEAVKAERMACLEIIRGLKPSEHKDSVQGRNAEYGSFVCGFDAAKYVIQQKLFARFEK